MEFRLRVEGRSAKGGGHSFAHPSSYRLKSYIQAEPTRAGKPQGHLKK